MADSRIAVLKEDFAKCQKLFVAIGDETRQAILLTLMETTCQEGLRVGEIKERTHLSRPAVSHHLRILLAAGVVTVRKQGAMNFYFIDVRSKLAVMSTLVQHLEEFLRTHQAAR